MRCSEPRSTGSWARHVWCACTRLQPPSPRTRRRCCGIGCWPRRLRTRSWPRNWTTSPAARPRGGHGRRRRGPSPKRAASADRSERERRLLRAADATITSGDFIRAEAFTREVASTDQGAHRDATLGYLAMMRGNRSEAENLLHNAFLRSGRGADGSVTAVVAQRLALHNVGRLRGVDVVEWIRRAAALPAEYQAMGVEAEAFLGVGLGWQG